MNWPPLTSPHLADEHVVLLDPAGQPVGVSPKVSVHTGETPLHLAFSTYIVDTSGRVLMTRRALSKVAWPGVWTNSCCGHPAWGEPVTAAASRRARDELGMAVAESDWTMVIPDFQYRAADASGIVEHEVCPVMAALVVEDVPFQPHPDEVCDVAWLPWELVQQLAHNAPELLSPWCVLQVKHLTANGFEPASLAAGAV